MKQIDPVNFRGFENQGRETTDWKVRDFHLGKTNLHGRRVFGTIRVDKSAQLNFGENLFFWKFKIFYQPNMLLMVQNLTVQRFCGQI